MRCNVFKHEIEQRVDEKNVTASKYGVIYEVVFVILGF